MHVLVLGGTGLIGRHLVKRLLQANHRVTSVSRRDTSSTDRQLTNVALDLGVPGWSDLFITRKEEFDAIVHLAYCNTGSKSRNRAVTTLSAIEAKSLAETVHAKQFIFAGTFLVYGLAINEQLVSELSPYNCFDEYSCNKADATRQVLQVSSTLRVTVIHPSLVYDRDSPRIAGYKKSLVSSYFVGQENFKGIANVLHADDCAYAIVLALKKVHDWQAEEFIISGEAVSFEKLFSSLEQELGVVDKHRLPEFTAHILRWELRRLAARLNLRVPILLDSRKLLQYQKTPAFETRKAQERLGFYASRRILDEL